MNHELSPETINIIFASLLFTLLLFYPCYWYYKVYFVNSDLNTNKEDAFTKEQISKTDTACYLLFLIASLSFLIYTTDRVTYRVAWDISVYMVVINVSLVVLLFLLKKLCFVDENGDEYCC